MALSFNNSGGLTSASSLISKLSRPTSTSSSFRVTTPDLPAPDAPDMSELLAAYGAVPGMFNTSRLMKTFGSAIDASRTATAQQGRNAGLAYNTRLMQQGVAPVAGGVVEAQARKAGMENTRALMSERESLSLQAKKESMGLQAMIANQLAGIRDSYTKTVADYNARKAGLEFDTQTTNAGNELKLADLNQRGQIAAAELAAKYSADEDTGSSAFADAFYPGYIPTFGPIIPGTGYAHANRNNVFMGAYAGTPA